MISRAVRCQVLWSPVEDMVGAWPRLLLAPQVLFAATPHAAGQDALCSRVCSLVLSWCNLLCFLPSASRNRRVEATDVSGDSAVGGMTLMCCVTLMLVGCH
eukprot:1112529-Rhodomonas_salina.4